jgi:hypothetical protein
MGDETDYGFGERLAGVGAINVARDLSWDWGRLLLGVRCGDSEGSERADC